MAAKVRVYELARELGLTNKETIDLCDALGIGVKSHSSSVVDAQADRVRRKAEREGLVREVQPEEPEKPKKAAKKPKKAAKKTAKKTAKTAEVAPAEGAAEDAAATAPAAADSAAPASPTAPVAESTPAAPDRAADPAPADIPKPPPPLAPKRVISSTPPPTDAAGRIISSTPPPAPEPLKPPPSAPPAPAPAPAPTPVEVPAEAPAAETPAAQADAAPTAEPAADPPPPPMGKDGKPIPPPPPRSLTGKRIPPPPGGPPRAAPSPAPGRRAGAPARPRPGGGAPPAGGAGAPSRGGPPGRGRPGGRPGGPGGPRRPRRSKRRRRNRDELQPQQVVSYTPTDAPVPDDVVVVERASTPQDLAKKLNRTPADVVRFLLQQGEMVTATQSLNDDMIELFAAEIGAEIRLVNPGEEQEVELQKLLDVPELQLDEENEEDLEPRPPVITIMGHVDHGKTLLLDKIRSANVVAGEAGGITQHIGAYQIQRNGEAITFIDTPGHEAFTAMRARGAEATDIVILVVAADDGVMPQTVEALNQARAADVPIVVAVNKIDRENADPNRVMQQLTEYDLVPEEWGGETVVCAVSAMTGEGIDDMLDSVLVVAELEDLRSTPTGRATGVVLESHVDVGRGPVATVLVERGLLERGDPVIAGASWGRARALVNDLGEQVKTAGPSMPVEILGLSDVAEAGDMFVVAPNEKTARSVAETREHYMRQADQANTAAATSGGAKLEDIFKQIRAGETATLNIIVKADANGSLEAVTASLKKLERDDVSLSFVDRGVGGISENDVQYALASNATILGFNVRPDRMARELAAHEGVEVRTYEIIYKLLEDIEAAMLGMLSPEFEEVVTGEAEVREVFRVPKVGAIAGCYVTNGVITRGSGVRFLREGTIIWKGTVSSLKRFKEDAREVASGFECGIGLSDYQDLKPGDVIETFEEREIPRT